MAVKARRVGRSPKGTQEAIDQALHHPWRVRILEVLNERDMSVAQFIDEGLIPELSNKKPRNDAISTLAYHFRLLREAGALIVVEQHERRGGTESICRGSARAYFTDEDWAKLTPEQRHGISRTMLHGMVARAEGAIQQGTFDARLDRHLAWIAMELDEEGWSELVDLSAKMLGAVVQIHHDAKQRLKESGQSPVFATWAQLSFESPPLPGLADS